MSYVEVWGSGNPLREFLHVEDLADACLFLMNKYSGDNFVNIGSGQELSIKNLAVTIKDIVEFEGELKFDATKPDGTLRKLMDVSKLKEMGWEHRIDLVSGLKTVLRSGFEKVAY